MTRDGLHGLFWGCVIGLAFWGGVAWTLWR